MLTLAALIVSHSYRIKINQSIRFDYKLAGLVGEIMIAFVCVTS